MNTTITIIIIVIVLILKTTKKECRPIFRVFFFLQFFSAVLLVASSIGLFVYCRNILMFSFTFAITASFIRHDSMSHTS